jgi:hypothetical protein
MCSSIYKRRKRMVRLELFLGVLALLMSLGCASPGNHRPDEVISKPAQESEASGNSLAGGDGTKPTPAPAPSGVALPWDGKHPDGSKWTEHLIKEIEASKLPDLLPTYIEEFAPAYGRLSRSKRTVFWAQLIAAMAKRESNFKPETKYVEKTIYDSKGENVVSRGLLQISIESARSYGCAIPRAEDLHDPAVNLSCAVRIMGRNIERHAQFAGQGSDGKWKGASAYWSVMRSVKNGKPRESYLEIRKYLQALAL